VESRVQLLALLSAASGLRGNFGKPGKSRGLATLGCNRQNAAADDR
jgi:hypothetical protein